MKDLIREVVTYLTDRKHLIVRNQKISAQVPAMTEGYMEYETIAEIEVIDFDALMEQILSFEASFKEAKEQS